jgi:peptide/nickel transport system permease protein
LLTLLVRRLAEAIPIVLAVASLSFFLVQLTPGSPASVILGTAATPEAIAKLNGALGLDRPLLVQYADYLDHLIRGDLGRSMISGEPVITQVLQRLPVTMSLALLATIVSTATGVLIGVVAAIRGGAIDRILTVLSGLGLAFPNFWVGAVLALVFALQLHLFPATGYTPPLQSLAAWAWHLTLPVITLSMGLVAAIARQTRTAMLAEFARDYLRSLRAAGVGRSAIVWKHALRNASIPVITTLGVQFVAVLGGAVVIEFYFALPGIGALVVSAATSHDLFVVQGIVVASAVIVLLVNLAIDLLVSALNPKVRRA